MENRSFTCVHCGMDTAPGKRCSHCQYALVYEQSLQFQGQSWVPGPLDYAVRLKSGQLVSGLSSEVSVDESQLGLLLDNGRLQQLLDPGAQKIASPLRRLKDWLTGQSRSVVLVQRYQRLSVLGQVRSQDGDLLQFRIELSLQLQNAEEFYVQLMRQSDAVSTLDLLRLVGPSVRRAILSVVTGCGSGELRRPDPELLQRLADETCTAASSAAVRAGLSVAWVSLPEFSSEDFDRFSDERARLRHDLRDRNLQLSYEEELNRIESRRFRAARMLEDEKLKDQLAAAERTDEYEKLKGELRQRAELRDLNLREHMEQAVDAWQARRRVRREQEQDAVSLRAFMVAQLELERGRELAALEFNLQKLQLEQRTDLDAIERAAKLQAAEENLRAELRRMEMSRAFDMNGRVMAAQTEAEVTRIQAAGLRELQAIQKSQLEMLLDIRGKKQKQRQEAADAEHRRKMEEHDAFAKSPEIVQLLRLGELAAQHPHLASAFADALRLAQSKGLTVEQLQILAAERSPAVAEMLRAKAANEQQQGLDQTRQQVAAVERVIDELKQQRQLSDQQQRDILDRMERTGLNAQQMLRDLGVAAAGAGSAAQAGQGRSHELTALLERLQDQMSQLRRRVAELEAGG